MLFFGISDFISNLTMARNGAPRMAIAACYGGPLLSILFKAFISIHAFLYKKLWLRYSFLVNLISKYLKGTNFRRTNFYLHEYKPIFMRKTSMSKRGLLILTNFAGTNFHVFGCLPRKLVPRNANFTRNS